MTKMTLRQLTTDDMNRRQLTIEVPSAVNCHCNLKKKTQSALELFLALYEVRTTIFLIDQQKNKVWFYRSISCVELFTLIPLGFLQSSLQPPLSITMFRPLHCMGRTTYHWIIIGGSILASSITSPYCALYKTLVERLLDYNWRDHIDFLDTLRLFAAQVILS